MFPIYKLLFVSYYNQNSMLKFYFSTVQFGDIWIPKTSDFTLFNRCKKLVQCLFIGYFKYGFENKTRKSSGLRELQRTL